MLQKFAVEDHGEPSVSIGSLFFRRCPGWATAWHRGRPLRLDVRTWDKRRYSVTVEGNDRLAFYVPKRASTNQRRVRMLDWRRSQLREAAAPKVTHWSKILNVSPNMWGIRMKRTMWGGCNPMKQIVWLNSDLIEKPVRALDYVILHEMAHLITRAP